MLTWRAWWMRFFVFKWWMRFFVFKWWIWFFEFKWWMRFFVFKWWIRLFEFKSRKHAFIKNWSLNYNEEYLYDYFFHENLCYLNLLLFWRSKLSRRKSTSKILCADVLQFEIFEAEEFHSCMKMSRDVEVKQKLVERRENCMSANKWKVFEHIHQLQVSRNHLYETYIIYLRNNQWRRIFIRVWRMIFDK